jgi:NAD(P)-dependent dehydrogenase (short-subunit alcohol dehydrogenase family)
VDSIGRPGAAAEATANTATRAATDVALDATRDAATESAKNVTRYLERIVHDRSLLAALPLDVRQALLIAAGQVSRPASFQEKRLAKALRRARRERNDHADREARAETGIRAARQAPVYVAPGLAVDAGAPRAELKTPKTCYVCKVEYRALHHFYDALCRTCGDFNYGKRFQTAPLDGRVALVTGARVKIGFHIALKMLRAGASVIAATRFPVDAARRYAAEADFATWRDRLHVHGLDLRHSPSVEIFSRYVVNAFPRLDALVNNACQTVRRPAGFYAHLLGSEAAALESLDASRRGVLASHARLKSALGGGPALAAAPVPATELSAGLMTWSSAGPAARGGIGITRSSDLSQVRYLFDDETQRDDLFPEGRLDADLQQVDLRALNSWRLPLAAVPTPEMLEVQLVNAVAPFILCARLKPLMLRTPNRDKHIMNVSAMEGVFSRGTKTDKHPHTNMAKAALNMMTLTAAPDYVKDGIHMNAVDTGWVTDEDPAVHADRKRAELDFQPPLDIVDGAARVCDPFFTGLLTGEHVHGKFLKDYRPSSW